MNRTVVHLATEFSTTPGGRFRTDGPYSGEAFREDVLLPLLREGAQIVVDLAGTEGFGSSFLEEAFGGLVRVHGHQFPQILERIDFVPAESVYAAEARHFMIDAKEDLRLKATA